jgi:hypothetical protein
MKAAGDSFLEVLDDRSKARVKLTRVTPAIGASYVTKSKVT